MAGLDRSIGLLARNRDFAKLTAAEVISNLGDRIHMIALATLVYHLTGDLTQTGIAFIATALPDLTLGLFAGALVDRWNRRRAMIVCDLLRIPLVVLIPFAAYAHLWLAYPLVFLVNAVSIVFRPARQSLTPSIVAHGELNAANSISSVGENVSDIVGYPLAGVLLGILGAWLGEEGGIWVAFGIDGLSYFLSALLLLSMRPTVIERVSHGLGSLWADVREGIAFVHHSPPVRANTLVMLLGPLTLGAVTPLLVGYAYDVLGGREWEYAMLGTGISIGSIIGGFWLGTLVNLQPGKLVIAGLTVMGLSVGALAATTHLWLAVALLALSGVGSMMVLIPSVTLVQSVTPDGLLGRVFTVRSTLIFAAITASNGAGGWAGQTFGVRQSLLACGVILVAGMLVAACIPSVRRVEIPTMAPEQPAVID